MLAVKVRAYGNEYVHCKQDPVPVTNLKFFLFSIRFWGRTLAISRKFRNNKSKQEIDRHDYGKQFPSSSSTIKINKLASKQVFA